MLPTDDRLKRQVLEQAHLAAQAVEHEYWRATVLKSIAFYHARVGQEEQALEIAMTVQDDACRARTLLKLLPHLTPPRQQQALNQAWASAEAVSDGSSRSHTRAEVAMHFPEPQKSRFFEQALASALDIKEEVSRVSALEKILCHLHAESLQQALQAARTMQKKAPRARVLAEIALSLPEPQRQEVLEQAFEAVYTTAEDPPTGGLRVEAVGSDTVSLKKILTTLAQWGQAERALVRAQAIQEPASRAGVLAAIALHLAEPLRQQTREQAVTAAQATEEAYARIKIMAEIAASCPEPFKQQIAGLALLSVSSIDSAFSQYLAIWALLPHFSAKQCQQALSMAQSIQDGLARAKILAKVVLYIPEQQQQEVMKQALQAAQAVASDHWRAEALEDVATSLAKQGRIEQALRIAQTIDHSKARAVAQANVVDSME